MRIYFGCVALHMPALLLVDHGHFQVRCPACGFNCVELFGTAHLLPATLTFVARAAPCSIIQRRLH